MPITASSEAAARKQFGINVSPGYGVAWQGQLKGVMSNLFATRVASIPWLPAGWLAGVQDLQSTFPDDLVRIAPAMGGNHPNVDMPGWILSSMDRINAWQTVAQASDNAIQLFAKGQEDAGRASLDALIANADFWDAAYRIDVAIAGAPGKALDAIGGGIGRALMLNWHLVAIAGVAALVWYNRAALSRAIGKGAARG